MAKEENKLKHIKKDTTIIILGTFPSTASRNTFFYHKSTNQFWTILSRIYKCDNICHLPKNKISENAEKQLIESRKEFLTKHQIGLWDIIEKCDIKGSSDSSIKNPNYNDLIALKSECPNLKSVYFSSKKAFQYYQKYLKQIDEMHKNWLEKMSNKEEHILPSPSSANACMRLDDKIKKWEELLTKYI